jgi:membrane protein implicated in regulation of membrane protease activity
LYLAALILGLGTILVQLFMGGSGDADVHVSTELDHGLEHEVDGHAHGAVDPGFLPIFLSLRFWTFSLLAFGMVGSALTLLGVTSALFTALTAAAMGFASGALASWVFRALNRAQVSSGAAEDDPVGQVGKVLIGLGPERRGKVRIELKGQTLDLIATTDDAELVEGEQVLVEEMREGRAHVSKAPDFLERS